MRTGFNLLYSNAMVFFIIFNLYSGQRTEPYEVWDPQQLFYIPPQGEKSAHRWLYLVLGRTVKARSSLTLHCPQGYRISRLIASL